MRIIVVFIFLLAASQALAEVSGSLSCKVKSNDVISISDGKPERYSHFIDEFEVGDTLTFNYRASKFPELGFKDIWCSLEDELSYKVVSEWHSFSEARYAESWAEILRLDKYAISTRSSVGGWIFLSEDLINCDDGFLQSLRFSRYYKSDYQGILIREPLRDDLTAQIATFDCRTIENNIENVIDFFADK